MNAPQKRGILLYKGYPVYHFTTDNVTAGFLNWCKRVV